MTTKEQAKAELVQTEARLKELVAIINAPDEPDNGIFIPKEGDEYCSMGHYPPDGGFLADEGAYTSATSEPQGAAFRTEAIAQAHADALNTFYLLRVQRGVVAPVEGDQYVVCRDLKGTWVDTETWYMVGNKLEILSPTFDTEENAELAIETVGADNILHMFNTFAGVKSKSSS